MFVPHTRLPTHSPSLSQSPSPNSQGYKAVQHAHVPVVPVPVQSQTVPFETGVVVVVVVVVVVIIDASEIKQKKSLCLPSYQNPIKFDKSVQHSKIVKKNKYDQILTY